MSLSDLAPRIDGTAERCRSRGDVLQTPTIRGRSARDRIEDELVSFRRDCRLITGTRTPPSPQGPDPTDKLTGLRWPAYLNQRREAIYQEFG